MRNWCVPSSYHNKFFEKFRQLKQSSKSIKEYHKKLLFMCKANVNKGPEILMEKFLIGLNKEIADKIELYHYETMEDLVHLTIEVEAH
ncbi:hypothetical protein AHAS_Ahas19G0216400 [Arachis hypogaea]